MRVYIAYMDYETEDRLGYVSITEVKGGYDVLGYSDICAFRVTGNLGSFGHIKWHKEVIRLEATYED